MISFEGEKISNCLRWRRRYCLLRRRGNCKLSPITSQCHHVTSSRHIITSHHHTSHHVVTSHHVTSRHSTPHHVTSRHITSHHVTSRHSHHVTSRHITVITLNHIITAHHVTSNHTTSHRITPSHPNTRASNHIIALIMFTSHSHHTRIFELIFSLHESRFSRANLSLFLSSSVEGLCLWFLKIDCSQETEKSKYHRSSVYEICRSKVLVRWLGVGCDLNFVFSVCFSQQPQLRYDLCMRLLFVAAFRENQTKLTPPPPPTAALNPGPKAPPLRSSGSISRPPPPGKLCVPRIEYGSSTRPHCYHLPGSVGAQRDPVRCQQSMREFGRDLRCEWV
jgi:hypothetical protein